MNSPEEIVKIPFIFVWDFLKSIWFSIGDLFLQIGYGIGNFFEAIGTKLSGVAIFFQGIDTYFIEYGKSVENWYNNFLMKWIAEITKPIIAITLDMIFDLLKGVVFKLVSVPGELVTTNIKRAFGGTGAYNAANKLTFGAIGGAVNTLKKLINSPLSGIKSALNEIPSITDLI